MPATPAQAASGAKHHKHHAKKHVEPKAGDMPAKTDNKTKTQ